MVATVDFKGKLVLLTGAGRGIGVAIARSFAEAGANLALTYNATSADAHAKELSSEFGIQCKAYKMPAEDSSLIDAAVQRITREMGEVDVVVANAGICYHVDADKTSDEQMEHTFKVNVFSPFFLSRAVFKTWFPSPSAPPKSKVILFVSSISGLISNTPQNQAAYNSSKAALTMLGKSLAGEWAPRGVRVNMISPGYIASDMSTGSDGGKVWESEWMKRTPVGRFGLPSEIGDMLTFLASDKATFMTGSDVVLDGGYTIF